MISAKLVRDTRIRQVLVFFLALRLQSRFGNATTRELIQKSPDHFLVVRPFSLPRITLIVALAIGWSCLIWNYFEMAKLFDRFNGFYRPPDALDKQFAPYTKNDIPQLFWDDDTYMWLMICEEAHKAGAWRWHWTHLDNEPEGRVVYWAMPFMGYMNALAAPLRWFTHLDYMQSLEVIAGWANPLLHALMLLGVAWWLPRWCGNWLTAGVVLLMSTLPGLSLYDFKPYQCDHQSIHCMSIVGSLLCFLRAGVGWVGPDEAARRKASTHFILSGILAGFGLWVGAARETVVWFILGLGILAAILVPRSNQAKSGPEQPWARLWQLWGRAAALTSLFAYLIEYFPDYVMVTKLEINTPLHSLAFFCTGELFALITRMRHDGKSVRPENFAWSLLWLLGLFVLPAVALLGPEGLVPSRDAGMIQMALRIEEAQPAFKTIGWEPLMQLWSWFGLLILLPLIACGLLFSSQVTSRLRAGLWFTLLPTVILVLLFLFHQRSWSYFLDGSLILLVISVALALRAALASLIEQGNSRRMLIGALMAIVIFQSILFHGTVGGTLTMLAQGKSYPPELLEGAIQRELGTHLYLANGGKRPVYMAASMLGVRLAYFGKGGVFGTQYENVGGVNASIAFFSDAGSLEISKKLVRDRGITHVVVNVCQAFLDTTVRIPKQEDRLPGIDGYTLGERLCMTEAVVPEWLEPIPSLPMMFKDYPLLLRLYKVKPEKLVTRVQ